MINRPLFQGNLVHLEAIDPEKDAAIESLWSQNPDYAQWLRKDEGPHPMMAFQVKKKQEEALKKSADNGREFYFGIHRKVDGSLAGFLRIPWVSWSVGNAWLRIMLPDEAAWEELGSEVLGMALTYLFDELNIYRVTTSCPSYANEQIAQFEAAGMQMEIRACEAVYRRGKRWDMLRYGMLRDEWESLKEKSQ